MAHIVRQVRSYLSCRWAGCAHEVSAEDESLVVVAEVNDRDREGEENVRREGVVNVRHEVAGIENEVCEGSDRWEGPRGESVARIRPLRI